MKKLTLSALLVSALVISPSQAHAVLVYQQAMNMTAFWDFNNPNPLLDRTGNGNNLAFQGGGHTFGPAALSANGWTPAELYNAPQIAGDVARSANLFGGQGFDLPAGIYTGGDFTFITAQRRTDPSGAFFTLLGSNRFRYQNVNNNLDGAITNPPCCSGNFGTPFPLSNSNWHFIALTYNDTTKAVTSYAVTNSGTLGSAVMSATVNPPDLSNITALRLGNDGLSLIGGPDGFQGQLDFAAFNDGLLTTAQLQAMLNDFVIGAQQIPEPSSLALLGLGVIGMAVRARRRRQAKG